MYVPFRPRLRQAPEILHAVRVNLPVHVSLRMVNRLVREVLIAKPPVRKQRICVDRTLGRDVIANLGLQRVLLAVRYDHCADLTTAFQHSHDGGLIFWAASGNDALALVGVHESGSAADERLIDFNFTTRTAELHEVLVVHRKTNAVQHEPCGFLGDAESAANFVRANAVLRIHDKPNGNHPLIHAERGILEDGPDLDGELLLAALAEPDAPRRDKGMLRRITEGT